MKKLTISIVLIFAVFQVLNAQGFSYSGEKIDNTKENLKKFAYSIYTVDSYKENESKVRGSRYLQENWVSGKVFLDNNKVMPVPLKFNLVQERFEIKAGGLIYGIYAPQKVHSILIGDQRFIMKEIQTEERKSKVFLKVLATGKCDLYKRYKGSVLQPSYNSSLSVGNEKPKIHVEEFYYMEIDDKETEKIKTRRRRVWKKLGDKKSEMKTYIKDNNLHTRKEEDLIKAVEYYNSL
jgi:hypothetical protein